MPHDTPSTHPSPLLPLSPPRHRAARDARRVSPLAALLGAALALAVLVLTAGTASAANTTVRTCWPRSDQGQTILSSSEALLRWTGEGELVLEPTQTLVKKIWASGTAGRGEKLCWNSNGTFAIYDAAGARLWSIGSETALPPLSGSYKTRPELDGCTLKGTFTWKLNSLFARKNGTLWSQVAPCPVLSPSVVASEWCMDNTVENTVATSPWSQLVWKPDGTLRINGSGTAEGAELWATPTTGSGVKLCFEATGRLAIYDNLERVIWSTGATGPTTSTYLLGLDDCSLDIRPASGAAAIWSRSKRCPQAQWLTNRQVLAGASDVLLLENDEATAVFQPSGNLVVRKRNGEVVWTSALQSGLGYRLNLLSDGNLVIYDRSARPVWAANVAGRGVSQMALVGCQLQMVAGDETSGILHWRAGSPSCNERSVDNSTQLDLPASGNLTLLRSPEASLIWQNDGNLVLYTTSGTPIWSSSTGGQRGKWLVFQPDGNLVIYGSSGPLWASNTSGIAGPLALRLGDNCELKLWKDSEVKWTGTESCAVVNYAFEKRDGDRLFGSGTRAALVAENRGTARLDTVTAADIALLGFEREVFSATAYQTQFNDGSRLDTASVTVLGESAASANVTYTKTFFEQEKTFVLGVVPVLVSAGATGEVGLALQASGGTLSLTPSVALTATVEAGVGAGSGAAGASAGIRGTLTLLELAMPFSLRIFMQDNVPNFNIRGDLSLATLSGSLALYARAFVKVWFVRVSVEWSKKLFGWGGVEWSRNLFDKTGRL